MSHPLVALHRCCVRSTRPEKLLGTLSEEKLLRLFQLQSDAPLRSLYDDKPYFSEKRDGQPKKDRKGQTIPMHATNRKEHHLAIALWHAYRETGFMLPDGAMLFPIDYEMPLKSHRDEKNAHLGKVDLFCAECDQQMQGEPWIGEIKIHTGREDSPMKALLQAFAYCAILDPDIRGVSQQSDSKKRRVPNVVLRTVSPSRPNLLVLAPAEYWRFCEPCWMEPLRVLGGRIEHALGIKVRFVRIDNCRRPEMTLSGPRLTTEPVFRWATADA